MSATIGHWLHFGFRDMLEMSMDEIDSFYEMCKKSK